jgi:hypothetical protein
MENYVTVYLTDVTVWINVTIEFNNFQK